MATQPDYPWARRRVSIVYRGRRMEVLVVNREGGHRHQVHEYLGYNEPYSETFGLKARSYSLEVVVSGDNYDIELEKHIKIFEKPGRGRLTLWHGKDRFVICRRWRISERSSSAGFASITVEFIDAGIRSQPGSSVASKSVLLKLVRSIKASAIAGFDKVANNIASIQTLASSMSDLGSKLSNAYESAMIEIDAAKGLADDMATTLRDFRENLESNATGALIFGESISNVFDKLIDVGDDANQRYKAVSTLASWGDSVEALPTPITNTDQLRFDNQVAMVAMVEIMSAVHTSELAIGLTFKSAQDAAELRDSLAALLDRSILSAGNAGDDDTYLLLRAAKVATVTNLDNKAARLPTRVELTFDFAMPSLVLSHRLYNSTADAIDLAKSNNIRHPGFIPAAEVLEVISPVVGVLS